MNVVALRDGAAIGLGFFGAFASLRRPIDVHCGHQEYNLPACTCECECPAAAPTAVWHIVIFCLLVGALVGGTAVAVVLKRVKHPLAQSTPEPPATPPASSTALVRSWPVRPSLKDRDGHFGRA